MKPEAVARTEQVLGAAAAAWTPVASRYALGDRWLIRLDDGRTAFAKRAIGEPTAAWLRQEHDLYVALGASFMPGLLGWEDGRLPLLVLEDLSAATWPPPWPPGSVEAVLRTLEDVAATPPPAGLGRITDDPPVGWRDVARDRAPFLRLGLCSDAWLDEALPTLLRASDPSLLEGDELLHLDVRSDNLCIREGQAVLVDWNWASVGNPAVDIAFWLPSLTLEEAWTRPRSRASTPARRHSQRSSPASSPPTPACHRRREPPRCGHSSSPSSRSHYRGRFAPWGCRRSTRRGGRRSRRRRGIGRGGSRRECPGLRRRAPGAEAS